MSETLSTVVKSHWSWALVIATITVVTVALRYASPIADGDIWFHMLYGQYFLAHKTLVPDHAIFSWTPVSNELIYCTWLADIFFYLYYKLTGLPGLFVLRYFCIYLLMFGCFLFAKKFRIASHPITWWLCLLAVLMAFTGIVAKPEMFSFLFMTLITWNWWYIREGGDAAWGNCYLIPVIMLIWVNSHGGFVFGVVFLVCIAAGELLNTWFRPEHKLSPSLRKHLFVALLLAAVALFITPYGYHYFFQLLQDILPTKENLKSVGTVAAYISPFSFKENDSIKLVLMANISILTLLILFLWNFRKVEWSSLFANLAFVYLYTRLYRTTFYWAPIFLFSSLTLLATKPLLAAKCKSFTTTLLLPALTLVVAGWLSVTVLKQSILWPQMSSWVGFGIGTMNPVAEAKYIKKNFPKARIGNSYDEGAYLLWELWPDNKVFIDARHFPFKNWHDEYLKVFHSNIGYEYPARIEAFIEKYSCDIWCIGYNSFPVIQWLFDSPDWQLAFYGKSATVFVRKEIALPLGRVEKYSLDLNTLKNLGDVQDVLLWAIAIKDWTAVDMILARSYEYFTAPEHQVIVRKMDRYVRKVKEMINNK